MNLNDKLTFEACVGSFSQAIEAEKRGANRIELCDNLTEKGTTPSYGSIKAAKRYLKIPFFPIIRPRGGDFVYSPEEIEIMKEDINICRELGIEGVVIGALKSDNTIDLETVKRLIELAGNMQITFHMAFDLVPDKLKAIDSLIELGVKRILTTGGTGNAITGKEELKKFIDYSHGRIIILPGGGVTKDNYMLLKEYLGCCEFHGTKIV